MPFKESLPVAHPELGRMVRLHLHIDKKRPWMGHTQASKVGMNCNRAIPAISKMEYEVQWRAPDVPPLDDMNRAFIKVAFSDDPDDWQIYYAVFERGGGS
jgi:hypothetical protein